MTDDFFLKFTLPSSSSEFSYKDNFMFLGSCFAENIGFEMSKLQFKVHQNPNGILYHPKSILDCVGRIMNQEYYQEGDLVQREESVHSWRHHGSIHASDPSAFLELANRKVDLFHHHLKETDCLVITFGTAHYWYHKEKGIAVANCHKQRGSLFEKRMSDTEELCESYTLLFEELKAFNPGIRIVVTTSPVRYKRDGLIESNRSKARLLLVCEHLAERFSYAEYFPSYELLIDQLRDYRFYAADRVHPTEEAIAWIWKKFMGQYFSEDTPALVKKVEAVNNSLAHRFLFPESAAAKQFRLDLQDKIEALRRDISHFEPKPL